jgi:hypothetical protein
MIHILRQSLLGGAAMVMALVGCSHSQPQATGAADADPQPMREAPVSAIVATDANQAAIASHQSSEVPPGLPDDESPTDAAKEAAGAKPFMFDEASLPQGFPPVGPVGVVVVKQYPAHRLAQVQAAGVGGQNAMFNPLFNHIKRNKIAMTAPVQMEYDAALAQGDAGNVSRQPQNMAFFYRDPDLGATGADARDARVQVVDVPAVTVISVALRGSYGGESLRTGLKLLNDWLAAHPGEYRVVGGPRYMGYNSPFVPWFLRMGEVQLPVEKLR